MAGNREDTFVDAVLAVVAEPSKVRAIISHLRTLGFIDEQQYSRMNTKLSKETITIRGDGAETIELARLNMRNENAEEILPKEF